MLGRGLKSLVLAGALLSLLAADAGASTFSNSKGISGTGPSFPTSPYPSTIEVSGLPDVLLKTRVIVTVGAFSPADVDLLLVAPGGQKSILMSDACGGTSTPLQSASLTFDDEAPNALPPDGPCPSGEYRPLDNPPADTFPPPAPSTASVATLAPFLLVPPNGTWSLFLVDDTPATSFSGVSGWALELLPKVSCAGVEASLATNVGTPGDDELVGTTGPDVMLGLGGNDTIGGFDGKDLICGGAGNDKLIGGQANDRLLGEVGRDKLIGQGGRDTCKGGANLDRARSCEKQKTL